MKWRPGDGMRGILSGWTASALFILHIVSEPENIFLFITLCAFEAPKDD